MCGEVQRCGDMEQGVPHYVWWIKVKGGSLGASDPSSTSDHPVQGSSARKTRPQTSGYKNQ